MWIVDLHYKSMNYITLSVKTFYVIKVFSFESKNTSTLLMINKNIELTKGIIKEEKTTEKKKKLLTSKEKVKSPYSLFMADQ